MTGKYTAHQLAMELGVSDSTVSRALSGKGRIGDERSREIVKIARERGLIPSSAVQKRTGNIVPMIRIRFNLIFSVLSLNVS